MTRTADMVFAAIHDAPSTWESGIHVYLKRATLNRSLFGSPGAHRRRLARRYR
ncbi:hypothetical protein [Streptomyces lutosisoli]|uniref:Transposase n=1 Tax=Streptomyces lutosisoli TaxID=2665721 RepID=A0ABW2VUF8_9ACTN